MEDAVQSRQAVETTNVALRDSEDRLAKELAAMRQLQGVSALLIEGGDSDALYQKIVDAAVAIMSADFASMQVYHPERGREGELRLFAFRGFNPLAAKFWEWVRADSGSACAAVMRYGRRVIVPDVEKCDFMAGTDDLQTCLQSGIHAVQTTPLVSRSGDLLGMISTHWRAPHTPTESELGQFDVLARQAADLIERKQAEERQQLLMNELAHRGKNLLAVIQTIVSRSLSGTQSLAEARESLMQRIQALARSQTMLVNGAFEGAPLAEIIGLEFDAFSDRVTIAGPGLTLNPKAAQTFALLAHELATNATKYGALSQPGGRIAINWSIDGKDAEARFRFQWQERDGPPVLPPTRQGFGRILIERAAAQDFGAQPKISYAPEGLSYEIDAPLSAVAAAGGGTAVLKIVGRKISDDVLGEE
jgi:two-component sensor histidine kinase